MVTRLTILGAKGGPAIRPGGPNPTSHLVELGGKIIVVDCGLGVTRGLVDAGVSLKDIDLVVITHLHSDHVLELGPLVHTAWASGLDRSVRMLGPEGIGGYWSGFLDMMGYDIATRITDEGRPNLPHLVQAETYSEGVVLEETGLTITALRNHHPPVTESYALRLSYGERTIVFSGDTAPMDGLARFADGADILVHEAMLADGLDRLIARTGNASRLRAHLLASHSFAEDAGRVATAAGVAHLVLSHLIPADDPEIGVDDWTTAIRPTWSGPLTIARDGLSIDLTLPPPRERPAPHEARNA
ncbi:MAG: MBL fold metallo-hydrolase [Pseudomonadota bacterium]